MRHINYIYAIGLALTLSVAGCNQTDELAIGDDMQVIDGIELGLGSIETSAQATTRATVVGVTYVVNTSNDPTRSGNLISGRSTWKLDFHLFNNNVASPTAYGDASFDAGVYSDGSWKPNPAQELYFPNYFRPQVEAWLYPGEKDAAVSTDQSTEGKLLAQDILYREKSLLTTIAKRISVQLTHQRAMINFKFEGIQRSDIDESTVKIVVNEKIYTPYKVVDDPLEYMLILPETATSSGMVIKYSTVGNPLQQSIDYVLPVTLNNNAGLGSNNCYCFTLSGKELSISPVTIVNWVTGEPVSGEYVAVTAYPTFKGPAGETYYFYYDNKLTETDGGAVKPNLQEINFNNDGECTIKPDGRIITHILKKPTDKPTDENKLPTPIILGNTEKMYINLTDIILQINP